MGDCVKSLLQAHGCLTTLALLVALGWGRLCSLQKVSGLERRGRRNRMLQTALETPQRSLSFALEICKSELCCGLNLQRCRQSQEGGQVGGRRAGLLSCNSQRQSIKLMELSLLELCSPLLFSTLRMQSCRCFSVCNTNPEKLLFSHEAQQTSPNITKAASSNQLICVERLMVSHYLGSSFFAFFHHSVYQGALS